MGTKRLSRVEIKNADKGEVVAVFSTFNTVDHDGDVTLRGFFEDGQKVRISAYNHTSWNGVMPVGKGVIRVTDTDARLEGQFFMGTAAGRETFQVVKELEDLQEWSYGFDVRAGGARMGEFEGREVRFLEATPTGDPGGDVHEVSPVMLGAGKDTRTLAVKGAEMDKDEKLTDGPRATKRAIGSHSTEVVSRAWDRGRAVGSIPADARPSDLRSVYAWVDPDGDPESKSSYKFPHHHGVGGPANARACLSIIANLNGARSTPTIPDGDRKGVYNHAAKHLRDADREVPELRNLDEPCGNVKFSDEATAVMAAVSDLIDRAQEVVALRASKGRALSSQSAELLGWIGDDLTRLKDVLVTPASTDDTLDDLTDEEIAAAVMAAVERVQGIEF